MIFLLRAFLFTLALACALLGLVAQFGRIDPRFDLITHFLLVWGPLGVASSGLAFALSRKRGPIIWGSLVANLLAVALLVAPEIFQPRGPSPTREMTDQVRVVSFNVWASTPDPQASLDWILAQKSDIVILAEASVKGRIIGRSLRQTFPYRVTCNPPRFCSTMIFSRWPLTHAEGLTRPDGDLETLAAVRARVQHPRGAFTVVGVHTVWPTMPTKQTGQSRRIAAGLTLADASDAVIAGDFNSTPWSFALRRQDQMFGLPRRTSGQPTWPALIDWRGMHPWPLPFLSIDQIYAGSDWATKLIRVSPALGSDHHGLVIDLVRHPDGAKAS